MFRNSYQSGLLSILYSCGSSPLELWDMQVKNGYIRRITDEEVKSLALEIAGTNVATTYIYSPKNPKTVLGITLPFLVMIIKNMKKYFTFEITILDDKNMHRRFRISNFQSTTRVRPFCTTMPIGLNHGWNSIQFNVADFTRRAYGSNYVETTRIQIHANCRIRRVYFADKLYPEDELPEEYKLLFPLRSDTCVRKKKEEGTKSTKPSQTKIAVEAVPPDEPPAFRTDSKQLHEEEETERQTTPIQSAEPSRLVVAPEGASKVRIEVAPELDDEEEEMEHDIEVETEGEEEHAEAMKEQETDEETTGEEQQSPPPSPVAEDEEDEETEVEASEGEEQDELDENQIE